MQSTVEVRTTQLLEPGCEPGRAEALVSELFAPHKLRLSHPNDQLTFALNSGVVGNVALVSVAYGSPVRVETAGLIDKIAVSIPKSGGVEFAHRGTTYSCTAEQAWVYQPEYATKMQLSDDLELRSLFVDPSDLQYQLSRLIGFETNRQIEFAFVAESTSFLLPLFGMITETLSEARRHRFMSPLVSAYVGDMVLTALLLGHPHNYSAELAWQGTPGSPRIVRLVERALRERPQYPWTLNDLAAEAGVSGRTVQKAFQHHVGMGPMEMLRLIRLECAHHDLRSPREDDSVTTIALRWGFCHMGRFAAAYQRRYHEAPSRTLRRSR